MIRRTFIDFKQPDKFPQIRLGLRDNASCFLSWHLQNEGSTIVEALIASTMLAFVAAGVYPLFIQTKVSNKGQSSKLLCELVVQNKLNQYKSGAAQSAQSILENRFGDSTRVQDLSQVRTAAGVSQSVLSFLTLPSQVGSQFESRGSTQKLNGFDYSKIRYNQLVNSTIYPSADFTGICMGKGYPRIWVGSGLPGQLKGVGVRECIGNTYSWSEASLPTAGSIDPCLGSNGSDLDRRIEGQIPGMKVYVSLSRYSPWIMNEAGDGASSAKKLLLDNRCPYQSPSRGELQDLWLYDFTADGDAIQVTVTGVIDKEGSSSENPNGLTCSVTALLRPLGYPIRYFLDRQGRFIQLLGNKPVFSNISETVNGSSGNASGVLAFLVHPRNLSLWVLRSGSLVRYGNCGGLPLDCSTNSGGLNGVDENGVSPYPDVVEFEVPPSIRGIAIDFSKGSNGLFYGIGDQHQLFRMDVGGVPFHRLTSISPGIRYEGTQVQVTPLPQTDPLYFGFLPGSFTEYSRITNVFADFGGQSLFVADQGSSGTLGSLIYSTSIYRMSEGSMVRPILQLPFRAVAFSK